MPELVAMFKAAASRWATRRVGGSGPTTFGLLRLVQWSFARAGVMPRVAATRPDRARDPVQPAQAGDPLFTAPIPLPDYTPMAIYLGRGLMIQATFKANVQRSFRWRWAGVRGVVRVSRPSPPGGRGPLG
jgi:cell wall-associated NlpC family hydrolase